MTRKDVDAFWRASFLAALPCWLSTLALDSSAADRDHAVRQAAATADAAVAQRIGRREMLP